MPIIVNHDNVVLDSYHRLMACKELVISIPYIVIDFTDKPQDEPEYVMAVNLHRRHLNEVQRAKIALKMEKLVRKNAAERKQASQFTRESGKEAAMKRFHDCGVSTDTSRISLPHCFTINTLASAAIVTNALWPVIIKYISQF